MQAEAGLLIARPERDEALALWAIARSSRASTSANQAGSTPGRRVSFIR